METKAAGGQTQGRLFLVGKTCRKLTTTTTRNLGSGERTPQETGERPPTASRLIHPIIPTHIFKVRVEVMVQQ